MKRVAAVALLCACVHEPEPARMPTDAEVRRSFAAHRAQFEALRDLALEEPTAIVVGDDRIGECYRQEDELFHCRDRAVEEDEARRRIGLPERRYRKYRELLRAVPARSVGRFGDVVGITLFSRGISTSGMVKEVRWSPKPQGDTLVADTDAPGGGYLVRQAQLDGGWTILRISN